MEVMDFKSDKKDGADNYFAVEDEDGVLRCSCGRELIKMDEETYKCPVGYPVYRFKDGEVVIDKFGNMMFKELPHSNDGKVDVEAEEDEEQND